jgi:hypothetical protein
MHEIMTAESAAIAYSLIPGDWLIIEYILKARSHTAPLYVLSDSITYNKLTLIRIWLHQVQFTDWL